jgi:hypothetical protein
VLARAGTGEHHGPLVREGLEDAVVATVAVLEGVGEAAQFRPARDLM